MAMPRKKKYRNYKKKNAKSYTRLKGKNKGNEIQETKKRKWKGRRKTKGKDEENKNTDVSFFSDNRIGCIKVLNVAEKPSVALEITKMLSKGNHHRIKSYSIYNPVFEFDYKTNVNTWSMVVTSVTGHLTDQKFDDKYKNWNKTDPQDLFEAPISVYIHDDKENIAKNLLEYSKICEMLILWLDCDREGEHICFEVINACHMTNKNLKIQRATFSAVTEKDITHAINNLKYPNENLAHSVDIRREIDLRIGSVLTRFLTIRYKHLVCIEQGIISYGPCQFPTLGFVVNRYVDIQKFQNERYWSIKMQYMCKENGNNIGMNNTYNNCIEHKYNMGGYNQSGDIVDFTWSRLRLFDHMAVVIIYERLLENCRFKVTNIYKNETRKHRPFPLNTLKMTKLVCKYFHISSKECMNIAEKLYNMGYISYPRTETNYFIESVNLRKVLIELKKNNIFGFYVKELIENGKYKIPKKGKLNDKAHPPIHPVKNLNKSTEINIKEWMIYEFICRHFLAVCSEDAIGYNTKIIAEAEKEKFYCNGLKILHKNYLEIYIYEKWNDKMVPALEINDEFYPYTLLIEEGKTQAPNYLSEVDLLSLMDKHGIGTDATMHEHIENIQKRNYVFKNSKNLFIPTNLGIALILSYKLIKDIGIDLTEPKLRSNMEKDMSLVALGKKNKNEIISDYIHIMKYIYQKMYERIDILDENMKHYISQV
ncbi:DNA topoisomerase 3, putative [Hepatocystis sp. ex Piliocolobus tephrosceles]|nr:DNA topoisomerase 3, putative [Hepatocystis sp. ex Piliocolobus tephrosceles]